MVRGKPARGWWGRLAHPRTAAATAGPEPDTGREGRGSSAMGGSTAGVSPEASAEAAGGPAEHGSAAPSEPPAPRPVADTLATVLGPHAPGAGSGGGSAAGGGPGQDASAKGWDEESWDEDAEGEPDGPRLPPVEGPSANAHPHATATVNAAPQDPAAARSRRSYLAAQYTEAAEDAEQRLEELLAIAAEPPPPADFDSLRRHYRPRPLPPEADPGTPPAWADYAPPEPSGQSTGQSAGQSAGARSAASSVGSGSASPASREYLRIRAEARLAYQKALREFRERQSELAEASARVHAEHEQAERAREHAVREFNQRLDVCREAYEDAQPQAVESVLERALATATARLTDQLPGLPGLPGTGSARVRYRSLTRTAVVDLALPAPGIVPAALSFRPALEGVEGIQRPPAEVRARYEQLTARLVLRALYALLAVDTGGVLYGIVLNGRVGTPDPESRCLVSVDARYEELVGGDALLPLHHAEAVERLRALSGAHSDDPYAQHPVQPRAQLPMTDAPPAPEQLSQGEFAALAAELFDRMGSTGWSPRLLGRDGLLALADEEVVCVARRPQVISADAVRSALEAAEEEGRPRCVWATTGRFHPDAEALAEERPELRLIDGVELRDLIRTQLGAELGG
ncbi:restriction endonuclease [Phaeacidiphilus oryzae]|uniref:restriction endonuclease n=1 Tax=Phaeacidiphilus oryzae TaxID=348818 RepID=UPI00055E400C|nr:restriction endonuclease [Phaeacidiphilus oryzae]